MRTVSYLNFDREYEFLEEKVNEKINEVLKKGSFVLGEKVNLFEKTFAEFVGANYCISTGNGLDSIELLLRAHKIGSNDEVICPVNSFIATALGISRAEATPVLVESCKETYNIDPEKIKKAITRKTKAIFLTHLYGQPAEMDSVLEIAKEYGLKVFEDAAQAHGAVYKNKKVGNLANGAIFSFYPTKNLGAYGDGGAITTNSRKIAENIKKLHNYGSDKKYNYKIIGQNSRLDEIQAAILLEKIKHLESWNKRRQKIASLYLEELKNLKEIFLPSIQKNTKSVWHVFCIRANKRDQLKAFLEKKNIFTNIHYPIPIHHQECYKGLTKRQFPIAESQAKELLSLPCDPFHFDEEILHVAEQIKNFYS